MKKALLVNVALLFGILLLNAQDITAATGLTKGKIDFQDFRTLDVNNLATQNILLSKADKIAFETIGTETTQSCNCGKYIAAMTIGTNGDLYYLPMSNAKLSIVNSSAKTGNYVEIENSLVDSKNQATYFARMTTSSDGAMYALNNAGTELLRISPNGTIQNLGKVNGIAEQAKSLGDDKFVYGGDMVADAFGNLYVLSAAGIVFKFNPSNLHADYLGKVKGLPDGYTLNGAAVMKDGNVLLGTTSSHGFFTLDIKSLEATFKANYDLPIYDMASPYFLRQTELDDLTASHYILYPTIVKTKELTIVSKSNQKETLNVSVWNLNNKQVFANSILVKAEGNYSIKLDGALQPGIYVLKAVNQDGNEVINTKFTLTR